MRTIAVVTTSRADYGINLPVMRAIQADPELRLLLFVSGMHLSPEFGLTVNVIDADGFEIAERVEMLLSSDTPEGIAKSIGLGIIGFSQVYARSCIQVILFSKYADFNEMTRKAMIREKWITTWWVLWILFFIYTSVIAVIIQLVLPYVLPKAYLAHGIFVRDSALFHQIAAQKAFEIAEKGWSAWELRPKGQYPAGITSIFYYLWNSEPYTTIPFNAALHATAGCLVFFLLSSFMKNHFATACGATLFIINPVSLEWTAQIHRDGTYILGNLLILVAWLLLIKGTIEKKWLNYLYVLSVTLSGSLFVWVSRPYWNQVALVSCILVFALILFYGVFNFRKSLISLRWWAAAVIIGCLMIIVNLSFIYVTFSPEINHQENMANQVVVMSRENLSQLNKGMKSMRRNADPAILEEVQDNLSGWQKSLEENQGRLLLYISGSNLINMKNEIDKIRVSKEDYSLLSQTDLGKSRQVMFQCKEALEKWQMLLQQEYKSKLEWQQTPYLPIFIENKLCGIWSSRYGTVPSGGNTLIDPYVSLNSAIAFVRYFPRAMQIGLFSPFPTEWLKTGNTPAYTIGKRISGGMMILFYICIAFFIWSLWEYRKSLEFWIIVIYSILGLLVYTYTYANVGTLSRLRYGFFMIIVGIGFAFAVQKIMSRPRMWRKWHSGSDRHG